MTSEARRGGFSSVLSTMSNEDFKKSMERILAKIDKNVDKSLKAKKLEEEAAERKLAAMKEKEEKRIANLYSITCKCTNCMRYFTLKATIGTTIDKHKDGLYFYDGTQNTKRPAKCVMCKCQTIVKSDGKVDRATAKYTRVFRP